MLHLILHDPKHSPSFWALQLNGEFQVMSYRLKSGWERPIGVCRGGLVGSPLEFDTSVIWV